MMKLIVLLSLVAYANSYAIYPYSLDVLYDPAAYDLLRFSSQGVFSENWYFVRNCKLISVMVPSKANFRFGNEACLPNATDINTYDENISLKVLRIQGTTTTEIGSGTYTGEASYGSLIVVPIRTTTNDYPNVQLWASNTGIYYRIEVHLNSTGLYPWRRSRVMSNTYILTASSNTEGYTIGLEYSIM